jgi:hypothetical protein
VAITVERLEDGEVSPYLTGELRAGDELELRGPVGGYFVWEPGGNLEPTRYRITVRGRLTKRLMSAFEGLDVEPGIEQTTLVGEIRDQSHLYGVLDLVRGLGLDLVSVERNWGTPGPGDEESARRTG